MQRIQDKGEKIASQKQDDKNVAINEEEVTACPDGTPPDDMEEGVSEKKDDKMKILMRKKMQNAQM